MRISDWSSDVCSSDLLKVRGVTTARVPLMGVKRKFSSGLLGTLLPFLIIDAVRREAAKLGYRQVELSWILEDNLPMRRINEALEGKPYKRSEEHTSELQSLMRISYAVYCLQKKTN